MEKTTFSDDYAVMLRLLREMRERKALTQTELAERLGERQAFVSKCERGERRLDIVQLRVFCRALGTTLTAFVAEYEKRLSSTRRK
jgi:ribosome-binding protein aMBF1 (putative translation factor)